MPKTFDCPKCGAPVTYERSADPANAKSTIRCAYCHSQLIAPNELSGQPAQVVRIHFGLAPGSKFPKWLWLLLAIPLLAVVVFILGVVGILSPVFYSASRAAREVNVPTRPNPPGRPGGGTLPGFGTVQLSFGSEGIGPGLFTDARSIAVDAAGQIYVG